MPALHERDDEEKPCRRPRNDWRVGFVVVNTVALLAAINCQARFPAVDFPCSYTALPLHRPYCRQYTGARSELVSPHHFPVAALVVIIYFFLHRNSELLCIRYFHCFMIIKGVGIGVGFEGYQWVGFWSFMLNGQCFMGNKICKVFRWANCSSGSARSDFCDQWQWQWCCCSRLLDDVLPRRLWLLPRKLWVLRNWS